MNELRKRNWPDGAVGKRKIALLRRTCGVVLALASALQLWGCTPKERTLLLPEQENRETEGEASVSGEDFSVKRIYTYTYETDRALRSAFLKDCEEHEIRILAKVSEGDEWFLECQEVDYRYGFYDTLGKMAWALWDGESPMYCDKLYLSPNGKQALIYSVVEDKGAYFIWLYDFERKAVKLLSSGELNALTGTGSRELKESFSPSGRWVTFDAKGISFKEKSLVPVYDCQKEEGWAECDPWTLWDSLGQEELRETQIDRTLHALGSDYVTLFETELFDLPDGNVGMLNLVREEVDQLRAVAEYAETDSQLRFDECYLYWRLGNQIPYFWHQIGEGAEWIDYMIDLNHLSSIRVESKENDEAWNFPTQVLAAWRMESGKYLILSSPWIQDMELKNENAEVEELWSLWGLQNRWNIPYLDLYVYQKNAENGELLYKNIHNLISFEYDAATRRVLLEVCGDNDLERTCIILEL